MMRLWKWRINRHRRRMRRTLRRNGARVALYGLREERIRTRMTWMKRELEKRTMHRKAVVFVFVDEGKRLNGCTCLIGNPSKYYKTGIDILNKLGIPVNQIWHTDDVMQRHRIKKYILF